MAGVTRRSAVLFPVRRRHPRRPRNQLDLTSGERLISGPHDQLLTLFEDIWVKESYLPQGWDGPQGPTVVDIGANVGVFAVWAARRLGASRLVAVEPSPTSCAQLRANLARNGVREARVIEGAFGAAGSIEPARGRLEIATQLFELDRCAAVAGRGERYVLVSQRVGQIGE